MATPASKVSDYADWELTIAAAENKPIIPVWADDDDWLRCAPAGKHKIQYGDMRGANYRAGLEKLLAALNGDRPAAGVVVPTLAATREFEFSDHDMQAKPNMTRSRPTARFGIAALDGILLHTFSPSGSQGVIAQERCDKDCVGHHCDRIGEPQDCRTIS